MTLARALLVALALAACPVVGAAQEGSGSPVHSPVGSRGSQEDQRACAPDARRLCREQVGDDMAVLGCFKENRAKLSRACREVLERHGQ
jgi:hypothetical protein